MEKVERRDLRDVIKADRQESRLEGGEDGSDDVKG